ncbi:Reticulon-domain-containing protein [Phycomyces blakesleeanus]
MNHDMNMNNDLNVNKNHDLNMNRSSRGTHNRLNNTSTDNNRNEVVSNIEREIWTILKWDNPTRSGVILALLVSSIVVTRHYSLLQISAGILTLAIAINFAYVTTMVQGQKVFYDGKTSHPYSNVINDDNLTSMNRSRVHHFSTLMVDLAETIIRGLSKIILIEDSKRSLKWLAIFYLTWTASAYISTMTIILTFIISAFIFPRLYMSNKDVLDHHFNRGEQLLKTKLERTQNMAAEGVSDAYSKTRAYVAQIGTTGTDAANTFNKEAVTLKED